MFSNIIPNCLNIQVVLVMEDAAPLSLTPSGSAMFVREEGLASLKLVQMVGMGSDTGKDEFDIHRIAYPGNFLDPQVLVKNFLSRISRGDHSEKVLLFGSCCGTPPSCLKV